MPSGQTQTRTPWQPRKGGLTEDEKAKFWAKANRDPISCWTWSGPMLMDRPSFSIEGKYIAASRIAWALEHPGQEIPPRLINICSNNRCVAPHHHRAGAKPQIKDGKSVTQRDSELRAREGRPSKELLETMDRANLAIRREDGESGFDGIPIPEALERLAEAQLGIPARAPRSMHHRTEVQSTESGPVHVEAIMPNRFKAPIHWNGDGPSGEEIVEFLNMPGLTHLHFPSGTVWLKHPRFSVSADDLPTAVRRAMLQTKTTWKGRKH